MSDSNDRSPNAPETAQAEGHGESLLDRLKIALGLKAPPSIREDLAGALEEGRGRQDTSFSPEERAMLKNILSLRGTRVDDIMVPRADIVAVPLDITLADLLTLFQTAGHSRLPVYGETLDDPRGMVHIRDFVAWMSSRATIAARRGRRTKGGEARGPTQLALGTIDLSTTLGAVKSLVRNVLFVPPSMPAIDLMAKMQATRTQLALVIDEYGGTDGLVSMEDIVEIVIGDIEDEHDEDEGDMIVAAGPGLFNADARADLDDVAAAIGMDMQAEEIEADVDTLGGWLVTLAGRVPVRGEIIQGPGSLEFEILDADPRRVKRVRIHTAGNGTAKPKGGKRSAAPAEEPAPPPALPAPAVQQALPAPSAEALRTDGQP
ncbi:hemolysin family protein [Labrys wisconsinensis]|uniref:CBS domain containing-hemolysin-like protein n=1 Tax=Labrys wisconsinensis TaxID=425677 RepID=A0ABU0JFJ2_9HYPH|nr:hemolysin family protein [Labrys wisconsinensis]MDQ0472365.1 CBS domain containing-hemolysin-like protein [Labrys wisconsinensis]